MAFAVNSTWDIFPLIYIVDIFMLLGYFILVLLKRMRIKNVFLAVCSEIQSGTFDMKLSVHNCEQNK